MLPARIHAHAGFLGKPLRLDALRGVLAAHDLACAGPRIS
jgi:hypothetical protein